MGAEGISRSSAIGADSNKVNDAATSAFEILDCKSKIDYSNEEGVTIASVRGDIDFRNVCFSYPLRPSIQIFKDLSLSIPSGKVVVFIRKKVAYTFSHDAELNFSGTVLADRCTGWGEWKWEVHGDCTA